MPQPPRWPEIALSLAVVLAVSYLAADLLVRLARTLFVAILGGGEAARRQIPFVRQPLRVLRATVFLLLTVVLALPAMKIAGLRVSAGHNPEVLLEWALNSGVRIAIIALVAYLVVRAGSIATRRFEQEVSRGTGADVLERAKRAQTLASLVQNTLSVAVTAVAGLTILRELRVDIMPVLTGAGIVGLAIGFGAQTLVRDIISGFFIILENQVRVGDVAVVNGTGGLVESINLRTIVLRDYDGTVHVFPNGEIKTLSNRTKDYSYYVIDIGIAYDEDSDRVAEALRAAAAEVAADPAFGPSILGELEIAGIDSFEPTQVVLKARIKTVPLKQWDVGRELRKRIQKTFLARGITTPVPRFDVQVTNPPPDDRR